MQKTKVFGRDDEVLTPIVKRASEIDKENFEWGVYNDFACTVDFVEKALESKAKWETIHIDEKKFPFY